MLSVRCIYFDVIIPNGKYRIADQYFKNGEYEKAIEIYIELGEYKESSKRLIEAQNAIERLIQETKESLKPYIELLETQFDENGHAPLALTHIQNANSIFVMGYEGTVSNAYTKAGAKNHIIDLMEWKMNSEASEEEFEAFIQILNVYWGCEGKCSSANADYDEFVWVDDENKCNVYCWLDQGEVNLCWHLIGWKYTYQVSLESGPSGTHYISSGSQ